MSTCVCSAIHAVRSADSTQGSCRSTKGSFFLSLSLFLSFSLHISVSFVCVLRVRIVQEKSRKEVRFGSPRSTWDSRGLVPSNSFCSAHFDDRSSAYLGSVCARVCVCTCTCACVFECYTPSHTLSVFVRVAFSDSLVGLSLLGHANMTFTRPGFASPLFCFFSFSYRFFLVDEFTFLCLSLKSCLRLVKTLSRGLVRLCGAERGSAAPQLVPHVRGLQVRTRRAHRTSRRYSCTHGFRVQKK
jgi:hypothetical protein